MPDTAISTVVIGTRTYALTLNLLVTSFIGLFFTVIGSVVSYLIVRYIKKQDAIQRAKDEQHARDAEEKKKASEERHRLVLAEIQTNRMHVDERFKEHRAAEMDWRRKFTRLFLTHGHLIDNENNKTTDMILKSEIHTEGI